MREHKDVWTSEYVNKHRRRKIWQRIVSALACVVVFCTTYALILPAITRESEAFCGYEEHTHTDECYAAAAEAPAATEVPATEIPAQTEASVLICQLEEAEAHTHGEDCFAAAHTHEAACYDTARNELICTLAEGAVHTHGEICYGEEVVTLVCTLAETEGHGHTEACYTEESGELICTLEAYDGHAHAEACYGEDGALTCTLEETEGHSHGEACYGETVETLICGQEEAAAHVHEGECFAAGERPLICTESDTEPHTHTDSCFAEPALICTLEERAEAEQICTLEETEGHAHTDECYGQTASAETVPAETPAETTAPAGTAAPTEIPEQTEAAAEPVRELVCGLEEHTHELICYSDESADVETAADWEKTLPTDLTGVWTEDVLTIAASQLGYEESERNYVVENDEIYGYSRYGAWYGDEYGDWCAMFVSFCLDYAGVEGMPYDSTCQDWVEELTEAGLYVAAEHYVPQPGDVIFFDYGADGTSNHVGLVETVAEATETSAARVTTIEGNSADRVQRVTYNLSDERIMGYARLPYQPTAEEQTQIDSVIAMIDAMPSADEIDAKIAEYEEAEDYEGLEIWYTEVCQQIARAYYCYDRLSDEAKAKVTNADKLLELEYIWSVTTLEITQSVNVYQINTYSDTHAGVTNTGTALFSGGSADDWGQTASFAWWTAIVVEEDENGLLYISQIDTTGNVDKSAYGPATENGFVLLIWHSTVSPGALDAEVGNLVSVSFDRTQTGAYTGSSYGSITFADGKFKPDKDNTSKLHVVPAADTSDLIELNLYNYGSNINTLWKDDKNYPGYQQDHGTLTAYSVASSNFGNNITADYGAGNDSVTNQGGAINATSKNSDGTTNINKPASGAMQLTLKDGYPALATGTSLKYLFTTNTYAAKQNSNSINGLFRYNETTGEYTYNSRANHAQFNASDDTFTLYREIISSNFTMYPFGNFLPLNDITKESAQLQTINRTYLEEIASSALYKANNGAGTQYATLASAMNTWFTKMDAQYSSGWDADEAIEAYFNKSSPVTGASIDFDAINAAYRAETGLSLWDNLYSIDYDEETDFFFGMEMKMSLVQPKDGMTGNDTNQDGAPDYPMEFYFTGDDDVWVYLDGVLFLDLSGIHRHVGGKIDFVNGVISYYSLDTTTGDVSTTPYHTVTFEEAFRAAYAEESDELTKALSTLNSKGSFKDYTTHTFNFYYMERGAGSGVCRLNFNFPLLRQNTLSVEKELTDDSTSIEALGNPDFKFQVLDAETDQLFLHEGWAYSLYDVDGSLLQEIVVSSKYPDGRVQEMSIKDAGGNVICTETYNSDGTLNTRSGDGQDKVLRIGDNGVFTLKAGQRAEFVGIPESAGKYYVRELLDGVDVGQYGEITVSGVAATREDVNVGGTIFTGLESPVLDMTNGSSTFRFDNKITTAKLAKLSITKVLNTYIAPLAETSYRMYVTLDGAPLPVDTEYSVGGETRTVAELGYIEIAAGETATIENILSGTRFEVKEDSASAAGYTVKYEQTGADDVTNDGTSISGTVRTEAAVAVTVTNSEKGTYVTIPGTKSVTHSDGTNRTFRFNLTEVTDYTGATPVTDGTTMTAEAAAGAFSFKITYYMPQFDTLPADFYYRITEEPSSDGSYLENDTVYVAKVTVNTDETGEPTAWVSGMWKDGKETSENSADFVNTLTGGLTLEKIVDGGTEAQNRGFTFTITLDVGNSGLTELPASYPAIFYQQDGTAVPETLTLNENGQIVLTEFKHGEKAVISGIPLGAHWKIEETGAEGFVVETSVTAGGNTVSGTGTVTEGNVVTGNTSVKYTNRQTYVLPETGGAGTTSYTVAGLMLMLFSAAFLLYRYKKRRREVV